MPPEAGASLFMHPGVGALCFDRVCPDVSPMQGVPHSWKVKQSRSI